MLIVAALRWADERASVHPPTGALDAGPLAGGADAADSCALEHALLLAKAYGGRCVAVTVGPAAADEMLREALARGASYALRVSGPDHDDEATARSLAEALTRRLGRPDIVVCGDRPADRGTASTPAFLAAFLSAAQACGLLELSAAGASLHAVRRLDNGRRERLEVPLPAVCSVEPGGVRPRRASLPAELAARTAEIACTRVEGPPPRVRAGAVRPYRPRPMVCPPPEGHDPLERVLAITSAYQERIPPRLVVPPTPTAAADELLAYLREHAYVKEHE
ncbi:mycofactocin-associated electron transfer flavoprotein beta subunit [Streptomyces sp. NPDC001530]|uniref:mycofactocin-associated electron transfer flavoprotein beta subunit n=1 Tax=Streptomyces sp. NPDC001530 TaxID=3364582 RepID=UPI0036B31E39